MWEVLGDVSDKDKADSEGHSMSEDGTFMTG